MPYCYPDPVTDYPARRWKTWQVFTDFAGIVGTVRAPSKALACISAERAYCLRPGTYFVGVL